MKYKARPLSRLSIRNISNILKEKLNLKNLLCIPIVEVFESLANMNLFNFEILPKSQMGNKCGETFPKERIIHIREDIYLKACEGDGYSRTTIVHELFHFFEHTESNISLCRTEKEINSIRTYEDPEWQANCFAAEFLINKDLVKGMEVEEVMEKCKVSRMMATYQLKKYKEEE